MALERSALLEKLGLPDLPEARERMVKYLRHMDTPDAILRSMGEIPRHAFAPPGFWRVAYSDIDLLWAGVYLPAPNTVARIARNLNLTDAKIVLECGAGPGYLTCVLSQLCKRVFAVDLSTSELWFNSDACHELGIHNVSQRLSDPTFGWKEKGPFDAILVEGCIPSVPFSFRSQLKEDGVLVAPVGPYYGPQRLVKLSSKDDKVEDLGPCFFKPLRSNWIAEMQFGQEFSAPEWRQPFFPGFWAGPGATLSAIEGMEALEGRSSAVQPTAQPTAAQPREERPKSTSKS